MTTTDQEIIDAVRSKGLDEKIRESHQLEREAERGPLLQLLLQVEQGDEQAAWRYAEERSHAERKLREAEAAAAVARRELSKIHAAASMIGHRAERLRGELRKLADPRINDGILVLRDLGERARMAFKSRPISARVNLFNDRAELGISNSLEIAGALATVKESVDRLEVMREQPRPDNLPGVIEEIIEPCRELVRKIVGL